jgi:hypothetical protein
MPVGQTFRRASSHVAEDSNFQSPSQKIMQSTTYHPDRRDINIGAAMLRPIFCVVLCDGDIWSVEAEWPDGTIEPVDTFEERSDAVDWLSARSESWLQERTASAPA